MSSDAMREYIRRVPFHLVTLSLPSGKTATVSNPELPMFSASGRTLVLSLVLFEDERLRLIDVAAVEAAETALD